MGLRDPVRDLVVMGWEQATLGSRLFEGGAISVEGCEKMVDSLGLATEGDGDTWDKLEGSCGDILCVRDVGSSKGGGDNRIVGDPVWAVLESKGSLIGGSTIGGGTLSRGVSECCKVVGLRVAVAG